MKRTEYTIDDLLRLDGSFLVKDMPEERATEQLEALRYIKGLGRQTGIPTGKMLAIPIFGVSTRNNRIESDRSKINAIVAKYADKQSVSITDGVVFGLAETEFAEIAKARHVQEMKSVKDSVANLQRDMDNYFRQSEEAAIEFAKQQAKLDRLSKEIPVMQGVDALGKYIRENTFWQFLGVVHGYLYFITRDDVVQFNVNPAAGINDSYNFGRPIMYFNLTTYAPLFQRGVNSLVYEDFMFPNIKEHGVICWGTAKQEYLEALKRRDIPRMLELASYLISTFTDQRIYRGYHCFSGRRQKRHTCTDRRVMRYLDVIIPPDTPDPLSLLPLPPTFKPGDLFMHTAYGNRMFVVMHNRDGGGYSSVYSYRSITYRDADVVSDAAITRSTDGFPFMTANNRDRHIFDPEQDGIVFLPDIPRSTEPCIEAGDIVRLLSPAESDNIRGIFGTRERDLIAFVMYIRSGPHNEAEFGLRVYDKKQGDWLGTYTLYAGGIDLTPLHKRPAQMKDYSTLLPSDDSATDDSL